MQKTLIFTNRELEVIERKLQNKKLTQQDSNYLSKFVRPKLKSLQSLNPQNLLQKLEYNRKSIFLEKNIKELVLRNVKNTEAIVLYGSAIQTNYKQYNDIDLLILTKTKNWGSPSEKYEKINKLKSLAKKSNLNLDIQIINKNSFYKQYLYSPSLIYQLKDHKLLYGKIKIPEQIKLSPLDLRMKLDWSDVYDSSEPKEIYQAIRNSLLVLLLSNKIIDNYALNNKLLNFLGQNLLNNLKNNTASKIEKRLAIEYLKNLVKNVRLKLIQNEQKQIN